METLVDKTCRRADVVVAASACVEALRVDASAALPLELAPHPKQVSGISGKNVRRIRLTLDMIGHPRKTRQA
jgi:hypothetical protein